MILTNIIALKRYKRGIRNRRLGTSIIKYWKDCNDHRWQQSKSKWNLGKIIEVIQGKDGVIWG